MRLVCKLGKSSFHHHFVLVQTLFSMFNNLIEHAAPGWALRGTESLFCLFFLQGMRGTSFIGREASQVYSRPQWRKCPFLTVRVCGNTKRKEAPHMNTVNVRFALHLSWAQIQGPKCFLFHKVFYGNVILSDLLHIMALTLWCFSNEN